MQACRGNISKLWQNIPPFFTFPLQGYNFFKARRIAVRNERIGNGYYRWKAKEKSKEG
jgi:hypothetical protein